MCTCLPFFVVLGLMCLLVGFGVRVVLMFRFGCEWCCLFVLRWFVFVCNVFVFVTCGCLKWLIVVFGCCYVCCCLVVLCSGLIVYVLLCVCLIDVCCDCLIWSVCLCLRVCCTFVAVSCYLCCLCAGCVSACVCLSVCV